MGEVEEERARWRVKSFDEGFQLGASIAHESTVDIMADALLRVLGKDRGDGYIDLGAAGRWYPGTDSERAERVSCAHAYLWVGERCSICGQLQ